MSRHCDGDACAFRALYGLVAPRLLTYLNRVVRDGPLAEEVLQQTFIKLHRARGSYVRGADPVPWLYTIAHRTSLDELRRTQRTRARMVSLANWVRDTPHGATDDGRLGYEASNIDRVLAAIDRLPTKLRLAIVLTKLHGKTNAEAATLLGATPGAVKLRVHRGTKLLRAAFTTGHSILRISPRSPQPEARA